MGEPLLSSTLLLPGDEEALTQGWEIKERLDHVLDAVLDSGDCGEVPTTVVDFSSGAAEVVRVGAGDARCPRLRVSMRQSVVLQRTVLVAPLLVIVTWSSTWPTFFVVVEPLPL